MSFDPSQTKGELAKVELEHFEIARIEWIESVTLAINHFYPGVVLDLNLQVAREPNNPAGLLWRVEIGNKRKGNIVTLVGNDRVFQRFEYLAGGEYKVVRPVEFSVWTPRQYLGPCDPIEVGAELALMSNTKFQQENSLE